MALSSRFGGVLLGAMFTLAGCGPPYVGSGNVATPKMQQSAAMRSGPTRPGRLSVLGFWAHSQALPLSVLAANSQAVSILSPFWYSLDAQGVLHAKVDQGLLQVARQKHMKIAPLVNDGTGTQAFLASPATRMRAVQEIDRMISSMRFQGVNIDFEPPHTRAKRELTAFFVQLRDALPKTDSITLDVVPYSGGAYDYPSLAPEVNAFALMSYDQHSPGTTPGPVAALNWVERVETRLRREVPSSKIYLGIALYGYAWTADSLNAATVPHAAIPAAVKAHAVWNARYQEMTSVVGAQTFWWENRRSIAQKIALARRDHLAGVALWDVGYADKAVYRLLLRQIGPAA